MRAALTDDLAPAEREALVDEIDQVLTLPEVVLVVVDFELDKEEEDSV